MPGFSSLDQVISALSTGATESIDWSKPTITTTLGGKYSLSYTSGFPAAMVFGTPLTASQATSGTVGAMFHTDPTAPQTEHIVAAGVGSSVAAGTFLIYDLLARYPVNGTVTPGTAQTFTSVALPARDESGTTAGIGVQAMIVNASATTSTATTVTLSYTNSTGVAGQSTIVSIAAATQHRVMNDANGFFCPLQVGDSGIRSIQSANFAATATTTQVEIQLVRPLLYLPVMFAGGYTERNLVSELLKLPRVYDGTCFQVGLLAAGTSSGTAIGNLRMARN